MAKLQKVIFILFAILLFFVPLVLWPFTSEVFEFNKIVLVYIFTTLIVGVWLTRSVLVKRFIFRRTILDIPLLVFLGSQIISTLLSIDPQTSWLGYYSRFNGGLASTLCFSLLYWAFVSNFDGKSTLKLINYSLLPSAFLVSVYGVFEHFGIDKNIWVQDVQSRVFSTLGQPNWLAAYLVALMPLAWSNTITNFQFSITKQYQNSKFKIPNYKFLIYFGLSVLFFWTLIFTKSRSGILGFIVAFVVFWGFYFWLNRKEYKRHLSLFAIISSSLLVISLISGTPWSPNIGQYLNTNRASPAEVLTKPGPALETGGTESGIIRRIVWMGAVQVFLHYPVFGSGVETFAFSYYKFRPAEHNLVSEWDFIYNKAHNEFLNMAANSGMVGLLTYFALIGFIILSFVKLKTNNSNLITITKNQNPKKEKFSDLSYGSELLTINFALLAGFASLLATNFFGFSVVPTQLVFFLFPALAVTLVISNQPLAISNSKKLDKSQKFLCIFLLIAICYLLLTISKYWYSDTLYAKGKAYNSTGKPDTATKYLTQAINLSPRQPLYISELANSYASLALAFNQQKNLAQTKKLAEMAITESDKAVSLSPANVNLKRARFGIFIMLSTANPNFLINAQRTLLDAIALAPTDAKLYYNLGLTFARTGNPDKAIETLQKTIELKANYKEARLALAILLADKGQKTEAKAQLEYILTKIDPNDSLTKQTLESIR